MSEVVFTQTLSFNVNNLDYEIISHANGHATVIKFEIDETQNSPGDAVVLLDDSEVVFHGMIGKIEDGFAWVAAPRGSLIPVSVH